MTILHTKGTILHGRYLIVRQIGAGGTSLVYLAEDTAIGKQWAVKQISYKGSSGARLADHEIAMMKQLDYPMFPRIVDAWQDGQEYYIVSDYIEGISLGQLLEKKKIPLKMATGFTMDLARALHYLHNREPSILYLDLKPENIMLRIDGALSLIDFGIAQRIRDASHMLGTPGYAAPEQYREGSKTELCPATDIFALGMTCYTMLSGRAPLLELKSQMAVIQNDKTIHRKLKHILLKCIQSNPDRRFHTMEELLRSLKQISFEHHKQVHKTIVITSMLLCMPVSIPCIYHAYGRSTQKAMTAQMLNQAGAYVADGEYTKEGIKIICSYIHSGCLEEKAEQQWMLEVARNYFEVQHNYKEAKKYFMQLQKKEYPEADFFIELCSLKTEFDSGRNQAESCLNQFYEYCRQENSSRKKFENGLLLVTCLEQEKSTRIKAVEFLEWGMKELKQENRKNEEDSMHLKELQGEYARRLCLLYAQMGNEKKVEIYGQLALQLLPETQRADREDITNRLKKMKETKGEEK